MKGQRGKALESFTKGYYSHDSHDDGTGKEDLRKIQRAVVHLGWGEAGGARALTGRLVMMIDGDGGGDDDDDGCDDNQ